MLEKKEIQNFFNKIKLFWNVLENCDFHSSEFYIKRYEKAKRFENRSIRNYENF